MKLSHSTSQVTQKAGQVIRNPSCLPVHMRYIDVLFCCIFLVGKNIENYRSKKNDTFNDLLPVGINTHKWHTKVDYTDKSSTYNHSENCSGSAVCGNTTYYTTCNGIHLEVGSCCRVGSLESWNYDVGCDYGHDGHVKVSKEHNLSGVDTWKSCCRCRLSSSWAGKQQTLFGNLSDVPASWYTSLCYI